MRRRPHVEDDGDEEDPLDSDQDGPGAFVDVVDCPYCGNPISTMAEQCPRCKNYIVHADAYPSKQTRRWVWATMIMVALLVAAIFLKR